MLLYSYAISFTEFPDEISLLLNISECPCKCKGCFAPELQEKIGTELNIETINSLLEKYKNYSLTLIGFMGGDSDHKQLKILSQYIKDNYKIKIGFYSGFNYLDSDLFSVLDYYKYGSFILPEGSVDEWCKKSCGPINFPWSNQKMFKIDENKIIDITNEFRKNPLGDLTQYIIKEE